MRIRASSVVYFVPLLLVANAAAAFGGNDTFQLTRLPRGKSVTIPRPATTEVPLKEPVTLTATDMPQSISLVPVRQGSGVTPSLRVAIFDKQSDRVHYADIKAGTPFLYAFRELSAITVIAETAGGAEIAGVTLQVQSNKPLEIAH